MNADTLQLAKPTLIAPTSGLNNVRGVALRQSSVRFKRMDGQDSENFHKALSKINSLKRKSQGLPPEPLKEPPLIVRAWSKFQELLGNR